MKDVSMQRIIDDNHYTVEETARCGDGHPTPELERYAQSCVASGGFNNASEVVRSGLRLLQDAEERKAAFVASLDAAVAEGRRDGFVSIEQVEADAQAAI
jgi:antitoxin ParD1/3/4